MLSIIIYRGRTDQDYYVISDFIRDKTNIGITNMWIESYLNYPESEEFLVVKFSKELTLSDLRIISKNAIVGFVADDSILIPGEFELKSFNSDSNVKIKDFQFNDVELNFVKNLPVPIIRQMILIFIEDI